MAHAGFIATYVGESALATEYYQQSHALHSSIERYPYNIRAVHLGYLKWQAGQKAEARQRFERCLQVLRQQLEEGDVSVHGLNHYLIGAIYAIQNNKAESYISIQKAIDTGWRDFRLGLRNPLLENLHGDAKFQQKMATLKELVNEMRQQREEMERK